MRLLSTAFTTLQLLFAAWTISPASAEDALRSTTVDLCSADPRPADAFEYIIEDELSKDEGTRYDFSAAGAPAKVWCQVRDEVFGTAICISYNTTHCGHLSWVDINLGGGSDFYFFHITNQIDRLRYVSMWFVCRPGMKPDPAPTQKGRCIY